MTRVTAGGETGGAARQPARWGWFEGQVLAAWHDDGRTMSLLEPFAYLDPGGRRWAAAAGSEVNGASIPQAFWSLIGGPFAGRFRNASVVHDVACVERAADWRAVHGMFYEACRCGGVAVAKAKLMYYAVYHFGPRWEPVAALLPETPLADAVPAAATPEVDRTPPAPTTADVQAAATYFASHDPEVTEIPRLQL